MTGYLMLILSTIVMAADFCLDKQYQRNSGTSMRAGLRYNIIWGMLVTVIFCVINSFYTGNLIPNITPFSFIMASVFAFCVVAYKVIGLKILKKGGVSLYTMFLMTGGMIVPYIYGLVFLKENFEILHLIGLLIVITAVIMAYYGSISFSRKLLILCVVVFFINGCTSVITKVHQIETVKPVVSSMELLIISSFMRSVLSIIAYPFAVKSDNDKAKMHSSAIIIITISALICGISNMINFTYAKTVPATVIYPIITGGTILFSILGSKLVFKEKLTRTMIVGVILCIIGLLLFV